MQLARAAQAVHFKSLCRLLRLNDPAVNFLFDEVLLKNYKRIASVFRVPEGVSDCKMVDAARKRGAAKWFQDVKDHYNNKDVCTLATATCERMALPRK